MTGPRGSRWGDDGPPDDAYSRVTEPERFAPLHGAADDLVASLLERYDVSLQLWNGNDIELERAGTARDTVRLTPRDERAAPLTVAYTSFPGLHLRFGRWHTEPFPNCGCDACDETAEDQSDRMRWMAGVLVAGGFGESLTRDARLRWWLVHSFASPDGSRSSGRGLVDGRRARMLRAADSSRRIEWRAWQARP